MSIERRPRSLDPLRSRLERGAQSGWMGVWEWKIATGFAKLLARSTRYTPVPPRRGARLRRPVIVSAPQPSRRVSQKGAQRWIPTFDGPSWSLEDLPRPLRRYGVEPRRYTRITQEVISREVSNHSRRRSIDLAVDRRAPICASSPKPE